MSKIEYPITISKIDLDKGDIVTTPLFDKDLIGKLVKIRPCAPEYEDKTYLGLYLGDLNLSINCGYNKKSKVLTVEHAMSNPAIFVFSANKIIFGCESWWGVIESGDELNQVITNDDIDNIWYVKMLKALQSG